MRDTLSRYQRATANHNYKQLCDSVFAKALVARVTRVNLPCDQAVRIKLGGVYQPKLEILKVKVTGSRALALVRSSAAGEPASTDTIELGREGTEWRLSALAPTGPQPPQPAAPGD